MVMSALESVIAAGQQLPESILDQSGELLYSGKQTLRPGPIYLLGLNPGGQPHEHPETVRCRVNNLSSKLTNNYLVLLCQIRSGRWRRS
jgi:hypothetical protein